MRFFQHSLRHLVLFIAVIGFASGAGTSFWHLCTVPLLVLLALNIQQPKNIFVSIVGLSLLGLTAGLVLNERSGQETTMGVVALLSVIAVAIVRRLKFGDLFLQESQSTRLSQAPQKVTTKMMVSMPDQDRQQAEAKTQIWDPLRSQIRKVLYRLEKSGDFTSDQIRQIESEIQNSVGTHEAPEGSPTALRAGVEIGEYRIETLLGQGGSGHVYIARPILGGETVAVKLLHNLTASDRFQREMELVQRMAHPNVVIAYEVGDHLGTPFIIMEHLAGPDLHLQIEESGPVTWQESIEIIRQAAQGLEHAHQRGLVHRDVKPANLMWDGHGRVKVTDLGLAALTVEDPGEAFETLNNVVAGTPDFMAPEQAESLASASAASDVYALGATWYFLLTGKSRVPGEGLREKLASIFSDRLDELPESVAPEDLRNLWKRMTISDVQDRMLSMTDLIAGLEKLRPADDLVPKSAVEVLVVEDDEDDLFLTMEMLKRSNQAVKIRTAHRLQEAIDLCSRGNHFDLVLLDLRLPDSEGIKTVQRMRAALIETPIAVLTGHMDAVLGQACIDAGADEFASKSELDSHLIERLIFVTLSRHQRKNASRVKTAS